MKGRHVDFGFAIGTSVDARHKGHVEVNVCIKIAVTRLHGIGRVSLDSLDDNENLEAAVTYVLAYAMFVAPRLPVRIGVASSRRRVVETVAIAALDVLIEKSPDSVTLRVRRADLHRRHRDWDLAVSDLEAARTLSPAWPGIDLVQGRVWLDMGWARSAEACATRYLAAQPKSESGLLLRAEVLRAEVLRAEVLSALERWDAATQAFADLVAGSDAPQPDHYLAWSRAERRGTGDRRAEALAVLDAGIDRLGPAPALHLEAIDLEIGTERFAAALEREAAGALAVAARRRPRRREAHGRGA